MYNTAIMSLLIMQQTITPPPPPATVKYITYRAPFLG